MKKDGNSYDYMVDGNIIQPDGTRWPDEEAQIQISVTPGKECKVRIPMFEFKARLLVDCNMPSREYPRNRTHK